MTFLCVAQIPLEMAAENKLPVKAGVILKENDVAVEAQCKEAEN